MRYLKDRNGLLFLLLLIVLSLLYNYQKILFFPPYSIHTWRQTDCLSITLNFYKENLSFLTPKIHWTSDTGDNHVISEFPIIYYSVAKLWKLFGQHEFIFRLVNILFVFTGLFSLYKLSLKYLNSKFWAIYIPLFLFTSPILVYYTNNFLADAPAFGMALTGSYLYYTFNENKKKIWLLLSILCISLAGLLKISSLIVVVAYFALFTIEQLIALFSKKVDIKTVVKKLIPFFVVMGVIIVWYSYARFYSKQHNSGIFLQSIYPIWKLDAIKRHEIFESLYWRLIPAFFNKKALAVLIVFAISSMILSYRKNKRMVQFYLITLIGIVSFMLLWFQAFDVHDYYLTNLLILIPFSLFVILGCLKSNYPLIFKHWSLKTVAILGLLVLVYQASLINRMKYNANDPFLKANCFIHPAEIESWKYNHYEHAKTLKAYETVTPYLREIGITRDDLVYSTNDFTINHTLYLMDQKGITEYGYGIYKGKERIEFMKKVGIKYLIVNNQKTLSEIDSLYLTNKVGEYMNIQIFKLQ